jgi:hypothetical protein
VPPPGDLLRGGAARVLAQIRSAAPAGARLDHLRVTADELEARFLVVAPPAHPADGRDGWSWELRGDLLVGPRPITVRDGAGVAPSAPLVAQQRIERLPRLVGVCEAKTGERVREAVWGANRAGPNDWSMQAGARRWCRVSLEGMVGYLE